MYLSCAAIPFCALRAVSFSLFSNHEGCGGGIARKSICNRKDDEIRVTNEPVVGFLEDINFLVMVDRFFLIIK
jgi:hypothetical protein